MSIEVFYPILWATLIAIDLFLSRKLFLLHKEDGDAQKLMFTIGLLMCIPIYTMAIIGIRSSAFSQNVFNWSALPVLLAFIFALLNESLNLDPSKYFKFFVAVTALTIGLYFVPFPLNSLPFLATGVIFALSVGIYQYSRNFKPASVLLFLSIPAFSVCFISLGFNLVELAIFAGFAAKLAVILAFEVAKRQEGAGSSMLVLKKRLDKAEENFSKLLGLLPDPTVIVDEKGTFLAINRRITDLTGYEPQDLLGKNFLTLDFISSSSKRLLVKNLAKRMLGFHVEPYEMELKSKDGRPLQFQLNALKIDYEGHAADLVIFRDFTERNKLFRSLKAEQERFQSIAASSGDWIWEVDAEGKYFYSNTGGEKILGFKAEELMGKKCLDLLSQNNPEEREKILESFKSPKQFSMIKHCLSKRGNVAILESNASPVFDEKGMFVGYRGVDRDITQREKSEEELRNNKNYLETLVTSLLSGILVIDGKTHEILDANPKALSIIGASREQVVGRVCHKNVCPAEKGKCPVTDLGMKLEHSEKKLIRSDRSEACVLKSVAKLEIDNRILLIENFDDISDRKEMEERLLKSEKFAAIGELATMVAHDLRNPLQGISASIHYVKKITQKTEDQKMSTMIKHIEDSIKYSDKIIRDLLDYSADYKLEVTETNPTSIVKTSLSTMIIPERIRIVDKTSQEPKVRLDIDRMKRVIVNVVTNAFDAMSEGGTLTITSQENHGNLELSFADTGDGIPSEKMERLWTPFVTTKAKGMGLGLPICKRILEAHNGNIKVETQKGKGTKITLEIPLNPQHDSVTFAVTRPQEKILKETERDQLLTYFE